MPIPTRRIYVLVLAVSSLVFVATVFNQIHRHWEEIYGFVIPHAPAGCLEGVVTVVAGGRLGNLAFEYAAAWAVAKNFGLQLAVPEAILDPLSEVFENLSAEQLESLVYRQPLCQGLPMKGVLGRDYWPNPDMPVEVLVKWSQDNRRPFVLSRYMVLPSYVAATQSELRQEFTFRSDVQREAVAKLANVTSEVAVQAGCNANEVCTVGVHVRRTDYPAHMKELYNLKTEAGVPFYKDAAASLRQYLHRKCSAIAFVVTSDDDKWCKEHLLPELQHSFKTDQPPSFVFLMSSEKPVQDLCLLSSCDHMIHSYGTFGMLAGVLNRGKVIVYDVLRHGAELPNDNVRLAALLTNWKALP